MRTLLTQLEGLAPLPFILLVGASGGVLSALPMFYFNNTKFSGSVVVLLTVAAAVDVAWFGVAIPLWWVAVRRRQHSVWRIAWHIVLAWALADVLRLALAFVVASIDTKGAAIVALAHAPISASTSELSLVLVRSPIRFLGATGLVALGRHLLRSGPLPVPEIKDEAVG